MDHEILSYMKFIIMGSFKGRRCCVIWRVILGCYKYNLVHFRIHILCMCGAYVCSNERKEKRIISMIYISNMHAHNLKLVTLLVWIYNVLRFAKRAHSMVENQNDVGGYFWLPPPFTFITFMRKYGRKHVHVIPCANSIW